MTAMPDSGPFTKSIRTSLSIAHVVNMGGPRVKARAASRPRDSIFQHARTYARRTPKGCSDPLTSGPIASAEQDPRLTTHRGSAHHGPGVRGGPASPLPAHPDMECRAARLADQNQSSAQVHRHRRPCTPRRGPRDRCSVPSRPRSRRRRVLTRDGRGLLNFRAADRRTSSSDTVPTPLVDALP